MKLDFVSDVPCPWCAVGLNSLERALQNIGSDITVEMHFQLFDLNPTMPSEGADATEYLRAKYGLTDEQLARNRSHIRERGAEVGFVFGERLHVWNTFDAHRLLHWAGLQGADKQRALKHALLYAYHGQGRKPGAADVLEELAAQAGLDAEQARQVIASGAYADDVRAAEQFWQRAGINSVPAVVIDHKHLI